MGPVLCAAPLPGGAQCLLAPGHFQAHWDGRWNHTENTPWAAMRDAEAAERRAKLAKPKKGGKR